MVGHSNSYPSEVKLLFYPVNHRTLGVISYVLEKIWVRHVPSSAVVSFLYIASFCGVGGRGGNKGGGKERDDNDNDDDD